MIKYFNQPHKIAFALTVLLIILTFVIYVLLGDSAINIQMHDTYFIVAYYQLMIIPILFYGFISLVYWLFRNRNLNIWLTCFHLLGSFSPVVFLLILIYYLSFLVTTGTGNYHYYSFQGFDYEGSSIYDISDYMLGIFLFAQLLLLINIIRNYLKSSNIEE